MEANNYDECFISVTFNEQLIEICDFYPDIYMRFKHTGYIHQCWLQRKTQ